MHSSKGFWAPLKPLDTSKLFPEINSREGPLFVLNFVAGGIAVNLLTQNFSRSSRGVSVEFNKGVISRLFAVYETADVLS